MIGVCDPFFNTFKLFKLKLLWVMAYTSPAPKQEIRIFQPARCLWPIIASKFNFWPFSRQFSDFVLKNKIPHAENEKTHPSNVTHYWLDSTKQLFLLVCIPFFRSLDKSSPPIMWYGRHFEWLSGSNLFFRKTFTCIIDQWWSANRISA